MGIDRSGWAAYGFWWYPEQAWPEVLEGLDEWDGPSEWLAENGFKELDYELGGNAMSGPRRAAVYVTVTRRSLYSSYESEPQVRLPDSWEIPKHDDSGYMQLMEVRAKLHLTGCETGIWVFNDIF